MMQMKYHENQHNIDKVHTNETFIIGFGFF